MWAGVPSPVTLFRLHYPRSSVSLGFQGCGHSGLCWRIIVSGADSRPVSGKLVSERKLEAEKRRKVQRAQSHATPGGRRPRRLRGRAPSGAVLSPGLWGSGRCLRSPEPQVLTCTKVALLTGLRTGYPGARPAAAQAAAKHTPLGAPRLWGPARPRPLPRTGPRSQGGLTSPAHTHKDHHRDLPGARNKGWNPAGQWRRPRALPAALGSRASVAAAAPPCPLSGEDLADQRALRGARGASCQCFLGSLIKYVV